MALERDCLEPTGTLATIFLACFTKILGQEGKILPVETGLCTARLVLLLLRSVARRGPSGPRKRRQNMPKLSEYIYLSLWTERSLRVCIISELQQANKIHASA